MSKAIYCNWGKGPEHKDQCYNPTQCYCVCHKPHSQTYNKLKQQLKAHKNMVKVLEEELQARASL